jgi:hypothetical protein
MLPASLQLRGIKGLGKSTMTDDHLDKETSLSAEVTPTGVKAQAKSRLVAAIDRLAGNAAEWLNVRLEKGISKRRAQIEGERRLIEAAVQHGVDRLGHDSAFAERALRNHFENVFSEQENKDAVLNEAIEDLNREPPSDADAESGPNTVRQEFLDRFEMYARSASTEELRHRWGRVLAAEIRKPDTFSSKVLRVVDEIDTSTAQVFERVCRYRLADSLVKCLLGELSFDEHVSLISAGLMIDPGIAGHIKLFKEVKDRQGCDLQFLGSGSCGVSFPCEAVISNQGNSKLAPIIKEEGQFGMPVYLLTDVGTQVSSILQNNEEVIIAEYADRLAEAIAPFEVRAYRGIGGQFSVVRTHAKPAK